MLIMKHRPRSLRRKVQVFIETHLTLEQELDSLFNDLNNLPAMHRIAAFSALSNTKWFTDKAQEAKEIAQMD